jgi:tetratricopeptide (TPR) repeat protein
MNPEPLVSEHFMSRLPSLLAALVLVTIPASAAASEPLRRDTLLETAEAHYALVEIEDAARDWEAFARTDLKDSRSPEAHTRAALLRVLLGQDGEAAIDAVEIQRAWGRKHPELVARITLALARRRVDHGAWDEARTGLSAALPVLATGAPAETQAEVQSLLGRTFAALGRTKEAISAHQRVLALAKPKKNAGKQSAVAWGEPARDAVAESRFFFAEQVRSRAEGVKLAPYRGPADRAPVLKYLITEASPWVLRRREANEEAMRAYQSVLGIEVPPPPRLSGLPVRDPNAPVPMWGRDDSLGPDVGPPPSIRWAIAAAERVGSLWADFAQTFRAFPVPREWRGAHDVSAEYYMTIDRADEPFLESARRAFEYCVQLSRSYRIFDEHTRSCETWLSRSYASQLVAYDEIFPLPTWSGPAVISSPMKYAR